MAQIREISKRIRAVSNIQRITKTMQMIATAKFTAAQQRAQATKPYAQRLEQLVGEVAEAAGDLEHPLVDGPEQPTGRERLLVITSDRGLCGAYNGNVLRIANQRLQILADKGHTCSLETSGKKAIGFFKFQRRPIDHQHRLGDTPRFEEVQRIADRYMQEFCEGGFDSMWVAFMRFESASRQRPQIVRLLPLKPEAVSEQGPSIQALYEFSPSSRQLLEDLLPRAVRTMLFQAFNEAIVSEQLMRMVAMKAATENARELGRTLRRKFNRARQTQITTELMEVIGGASALG
jgi:F-type H+-transporting ATPase subunit gamma